MSKQLLTILDRPIAYHRAFVPLAGVTGAVFLSQSIYWTQRTSDPDGWFYKTRDEWTEETGLTRREQEIIRKRLVKKGVLEEELRGVPARIYYRVNTVALRALLVGTKVTNKLVHGKQPRNEAKNSVPTSRYIKNSLNNDDIEAKKNVPTITEITTEITKLSLNKDNGEDSPKARIKETFGNEDVNQILSIFTELTGLSRPSDVRPRQWAHIMAKSKTIGVEGFRGCLKLLLSKKLTITKLETVYRQYPLYEKNHQPEKTMASYLDDPTLTPEQRRSIEGMEELNRKLREKMKKGGNL